MSYTTPYVAAGDGSVPVGGPDLVSGDDPHRMEEPHVLPLELEGSTKSLRQPIGGHHDGEDDLTITSVLTAGGIEDVQGFCVVCFVILVGDMARGVMFPSMWPLVEIMGGTTVTLGFSVAAFSFGRIIVSPIFGSWSITHGYTKTLLLSNSILLVGTLLYAQVQNVGRSQFLILAQITLGVGSGTLGVTRAFVADVTANRERTTYMAWITAVQYTGFTVTPFIGALFTRLFQDRDIQFGLLRLNMYTAPAYFMTVMCIFILFLLSIFFRGRLRTPKRKEKGKKSKRRTAIDDLANTTTFIGLTTYDACILGCMLLNVATKGSIASFETLGINYAESHFDMYSARAGTIVASCGTIGVAALLSMGYLARWLTDIQLICGGMIVMSLGIVSLTGFQEGVDNPDWRYFVAMFMIYSIGYPIGHTAVIGLFSKVVGRRAQGTLQGWFASAGSFARIVFPVMAGCIANYQNIVTLFYILIGVLATATIFVFVNQKTLVVLSS